jgi:hypothetical protein
MHCALRLPGYPLPFTPRQNERPGRPLRPLPRQR